MCVKMKPRETSNKARTDSDINVTLHKAIMCRLKIEWDLNMLFKGQDQATEGNVHEATS